LHREVQLLCEVIPFWKYRWWLFVPVGLAYLAGMFLDVMEADAAQYATMSLEMLQTGNYLEIYHRGKDYIDKPPLLFWLSSLSFQLFGVSNFAYKLPSVLFTLLGLWATYHITRLLHNTVAAYFSVLILASCQAWFMINHDVRTDTILAASTVFAIWQLLLFTRTNRFRHLAWGALGVAGAMLTKGPIGLMVPALALGTDFLWKHQWRTIFRWQWLAMLSIVAICLLPMLWGLYTQFDLSEQGKKTYNGVITSGLRFYFWTQSFGRLTGESTWKNDTDPFYFVHTFAWAFLPWTFLFFAALFRKLRQAFRYRLRFPTRQEALTLGGILIPAFAFSLSKYKLPHYIFVFFPLAAMLTGQYVAVLLRSKKLPRLRAWSITQWIISGLLLVVAAVLCLVSFPNGSFGWPVLIAGTLAASAFLFVRFPVSLSLMAIPVMSIAIVNLVLNLNVYPQLLTYQAGTSASHIVMADSQHRPFVSYPFEYYGMDFYYRKAVPSVDTVQMILDRYRGREVWVFTNEKGRSELQQAGCRFIEDRHLEHYHISKLTIKFLNPRRRATTLMHKYLLLIEVP
jgi:4-amino-4-deoxy-L-arabinose transferase-like glycosyltransferase